MTALQRGRVTATGPFAAFVLLIGLASCSTDERSLPASAEPSAAATVPTATPPPATAPPITGSPATAPPVTGSPTTVPPASTVPDPRAVDMRGRRYCEVLLLTVGSGSAIAEVYNSYPMNDCPAEQWNALDAVQIAADESAVLALLNGPRYWLMNSIDANASTDVVGKTFGGIDMVRRATVEIGDLRDAAVPYTPRAVSRSTVFTFDPGAEVYELTAADGTVYVMQTYSQQIDPTLTEAQLAGLGTRLQLPDGWTYSSRTLVTPLRVVTIDEPAFVLQDDLGNSYSRQTGG